MKKSKILAFIISLILILSVVQLPVVQAEENNLATNEQARPSNWAIEDLNMGYMYGLIDKSLLSDFQKGVTREEAFIEGDSLYEKLTGKTLSPTTPNPFKDTSSDAILKASSIGLAKADSKGNINPTTKITREEVVSMLFNIIKECLPDDKLKTDVKLTQKDAVSLKEPLLSSVKYLYTSGILKGSNDNLGLKSVCSRQEILAMIKRTYEQVIRASGKAAKGLFYKVSGGKSQVYILGSIHISDISIYPFNQCIEDVYSKADYLAVEANITPSNDDLTYFQQKAVYTDGDTIDKHISDDTYKALQEVMLQFKIAPEVYNILKPWYAALLVQNLSAAQGAISGNLGVDMHFLSKGGKKVIELEGVKFQTDLLDGFSPELQDQFLQGSLMVSKQDNNSGSEELDALTKMLSSWKNGDLNGIQATDDTDEEVTPEMTEFNDKFMNARNTNMASKVKGFLDDESGKTYFVVFGAAHLIGDTGVIKALETQGYKVEQVLQ